MKEFLESIHTAAANPLALVAYLAAVAAWVVLVIRTRRISIVMRHLDAFPEKDRRAVLEAEMGARLPAQISPATWLKARRQTYAFLFLLVLLLALLALVAIAKWGIRSSPDLTVAFEANVAYVVAELGNPGPAGIARVRHIVLTAASRPCPYLIPPPAAALVTEYRYKALLSTREQIYKLDDRDFKYGPGDIDRFFVHLAFADQAIYRMGLKFEYQFVGTKSQWATYRSPQYCVPACFDGSLPEASFVRVGGGLPNCEGLGDAAFEYVADLLTDPQPPLSKDGLRAFINENYPCSLIRAEYVGHLRSRMVEAGKPARAVDERIAAIPSCPSAIQAPGRK